MCGLHKSSAACTRVFWVYETPEKSAHTFCLALGVPFEVTKVRTMASFDVNPSVVLTYVCFLDIVLGWYEEATSGTSTPQ